MSYATGALKCNPKIEDFTEALRKAISNKGILATVISQVETGGSKE